MEATSTDKMTAAIFAGGAFTNTVDIEVADVVIAADSGYDIARSLGIDVDLLVGDMDSISDRGLDEAKTLDIATERHREDKDATDLEIAVDAAIRMGATEVTIYAGEGGRLDHLLGIALGITARPWAAVRVAWRFGGTTVHRVLPSHPLSVDVQTDSIVTLLPVGDTTGVTTEGLQWGLHDASLHRGTSLGLSNIAVSPKLYISIDTGALLVVAEHVETT